MFFMAIGCYMYIKKKQNALKKATLESLAEWEEHFLLKPTW